MSTVNLEASRRRAWVVLGAGVLTSLVGLSVMLFSLGVAGSAESSEWQLITGVVLPHILLLTGVAMAIYSSVSLIRCSIIQSRQQDESHHAQHTPHERA